MKKIIIFNSASSIDKFGGSIQALDHISFSLKRLFYKIYIVSFNYKNKKFLIVRNYDSINILIPDFRKYFFSFIYNFPKIFRLLSKISKNSIIWSHSPMPWFFLRFFCYSYNKFIYTIHGPIFKELNIIKKRNFIFKIFIYFLYRVSLFKVNLIQYNSTYTYNISVKEFNFLKNYKYNIVEILVNEDYFFNRIKLSKKPNFDLPTDYFLISRRLIARTGVLEFVKMIHKNNIFDKFNFIITGDGSLKKVIKDLIVNSKNIFFLDSLPEIYLDYLKINCKGFIIPSIDAEGYCVIAKEAILLNKYIFHTNQGGLKESTKNYPNQGIFEINNINSLYNFLNLSNSSIQKYQHLKTFNQSIKRLNLL